MQFIWGGGKHCINWPLDRRLFVSFVPKVPAKYFFKALIPSSVIDCIIYMGESVWTLKSNYNQKCITNFVMTIFTPPSMKSLLMIVSVNKMVGDEQIKAPMSLVVLNLSNTDVFFC